MKWWQGENKFSCFGHLASAGHISAEPELAALPLDPEQAGRSGAAEEEGRGSLCRDSGQLGLLSVAPQEGEGRTWQGSSMAVGEWWAWQVSGLQPYSVILTVRLRELNLAFEQQRSNGVRGCGTGGPGKHGVHGG